MIQLILLALLAALPGRDPGAGEPLRIFPSGTIYAVDGAVTLYPEGFVLERDQRLSLAGGRDLTLPAGCTR